MDYQIKSYKPEYKDQILAVWERSVLATHHFLKPEDFIEIKQFLQKFNFNDLNVFCVITTDKIAGFIGIHKLKIEMLFIDPSHFGKGFGKVLLQFAFENFNVNLVDVNEENTNARIFYEKHSFETFERTDTDDLGKNYPLLRMKLKNR